MKFRNEVFVIRKYKRIYERQTGKFTINVRYQTKTEVTPRTIGVAEAFGLGVDDHQEQVIYDNAEFRIEPKDVVYITGESGSGKSVLLRALEKDLGSEALNIDSVKLNLDKPIVETVGKDLNEALELLSRVGLNDAYLFLRRYRELSDGQRYRYRIAKLIESGKQWWIMDEFCATLDRETAKIVAFNVQKQARRTGRAVIVATTHTDLFEDLAPSVHIHKGWGKRLEVNYYPNKVNEVCSVTKNLRIEEGTTKDYSALSEFHYRNIHAHVAPIKTFVIRRGDNEPIGAIVYSYPPPQCFGRKQTFGRALPISELNQKVAAISRVVLHPKYRSIGLGARLVRETLPLCGRPYVETMAVMAQYNPFFEKAGMKRIAERQPDKTIIQAIKSLENLGFKPYLLNSQQTNINKLETLNKIELKKVHEILLKISTVYYKRLRSTSEVFLKKESFRKWLKKSSTEVLAKVLSRLAVLAETKVYLFWENYNYTLN